MNEIFVLYVFHIFQNVITVDSSKTGDVTSVDFIKLRRLPIPIIIVTFVNILDNVIKGVFEKLEIEFEGQTVTARLKTLNGSLYFETQSVCTGAI